MRRYTTTLEKYGMKVCVEEISMGPQVGAIDLSRGPSGDDEFQVDYDETDRLLQLVQKKNGRGGHEAALGKRQEINLEDSKDPEDLRAELLKQSKRKPLLSNRVGSAPPVQPQSTKITLPKLAAKKASQSFVKEAFRLLILNDSMNQQECMSKCEESDLEALAFVVKQRYTGTEYFKFPYKNKVISPENNKINFKVSNEKKCLPEIWKLVVEEIRKNKNLHADPNRQTIELFMQFHKDKNEVLRQKYQQQLKGLNKDEELNMLMCLYGEEFLDLPT